jgi:hypothetical protein
VTTVAPLPHPQTHQTKQNKKNKKNILNKGFENIRTCFI